MACISDGPKSYLMSTVTAAVSHHPTCTLQSEASSEEEKETHQADKKET